jgi:hypothetical protein
VIIHADYTHSLIGAALLPTVFGAVAAVRYGRAGGLILGLVVMSHWVLDLIVHRADMPILPGGSGMLPRLGFGLWAARIAACPDSGDCQILAQGSQHPWHNKEFINSRDLVKSI